MPRQAVSLRLTLLAFAVSLAGCDAGPKTPAERVEREREEVLEAEKALKDAPGNVVEQEKELRDAQGEVVEQRRELRDAESAVGDAERQLVKERGDLEAARKAAGTGGERPPAGATPE